jgi:predicted enzyme related to lactoylglutathione lyase
VGDGIPRIPIGSQRGGRTSSDRVHLDIPVRQEELDDEVQRVTRAGAGFVEFRSHPGHRWAVMQDPEGNEFCLH